MLLCPMFVGHLKYKDTRITKCTICDMPVYLLGIKEGYIPNQYD